MAHDQIPDVTGPNSWMVDEMYELYLADPSSVSEAWQDFFADYRRDIDETSPAPTAGPDGSKATPSAREAPESESSASADSGGEATRASRPQANDEPEPGEPIRGVGARIVENMEQSLEVPTATSFREVPAKLLEVNRKVINGYLGRTRGGKVSFTHLIGYAVVRAIADTMPVMNHSFVEGADGKPRRVRNEHVGLGIAVDVEKADGSRSLMVPCIKEADALDFKGFWANYEEIIRKVRNNKLTPDDFSGVTVSLTNPGTIGTVQSVPRLMPGQGTIVGVGAIDFPAEYQAADSDTLADLGVSKVITISSTYDHRIIQGAESGMFLKRVHELLLGEDEFYEDVFRALGVPYEAVQWRTDVRPVDQQQHRLEKQMAVQRLINMYRVRGHLIADLDPLRWREPHFHPELDPLTYGLTIWDLDRVYLTGGLAGQDRMDLGSILKVLRDAYCRTMGIEYMHIQEPDQKAWIQQEVEGVSVELTTEEQQHVLGRLNAAEAFEKFLATKYVGQKRFGLEGGESAIVILDAVLEAAADQSMDKAVLGMAHRGRLNVLVNIAGKHHDKLFSEFEGFVPENSVQGSGDVKYHLGQEGVFESRHGTKLPVALAANPSHLEAVDPVVVGMVRAIQDQIDVPDAFSVLPVLIHGDAAFAGQGVVAETLQMSDIRGYRVGGTIHLIINNQIGYTTTPDASRSGFYTTDVAKMIQAPVIHVNGDDPEACVRAARLAMGFRERFNKDVVIDMVCYRRHGHNEGDDPSYTQPQMYTAIDQHRSVRKLYTESLVRRNHLTLEEAEQALDDFQARLQAKLDETRESAPDAEYVAAEPPPPPGVLPHAETAVERPVLDQIFSVMDSWPESFHIHPKLERQFKSRRKLWEEEGEVDWHLAEAFAYGSLLLEGIDIRLAGQDTRRGTFAHRHAVYHDHENGTEYVPLANLADQSEQGKFWVYDSLLSEYAALGFEYGYSVENKDALVLWEAQFGDFVNGAQIIIDQFLVSGSDKWDEDSGLVLLLPHGYEGQGPEHSSARMERFLLLAAEDNIQVANCSTAAQFFHLLRRQSVRDIRRPLIVFTPKSLLRAKPARSPVGELTSGTFEEVLPDMADIDASSVNRVVLCSGKVAQDAIAARDERGAPVAIVRVEQLYPWPEAMLAEQVGRYPNATEIVWLQEEPENMGAWNFAKGRLYDGFGDSHKIQRVSRFESGSPATGSNTIHNQEQAAILDKALSF
ncbi:MAG: multifunctional oxoglutarate decarboxylase/oxoglutarate dehydrogenase thiamine pyrophosphate-binding subunit/dihydrolipoyllysine-residue succinyltransferase subunit [Acidimicrobiales bacterium]|nr:multifunctional oxoglutarate decarboxylase/oxoglutarate dehydrogenase thiamine pyrophosphate-binding subunit/dihydrolipoyllysine-residue succinyltransferase subunit [Acidimicrobiales bacterium]